MWPNCSKGNYRRLATVLIKHNGKHNKKRYKKYLYIVHKDILDIFSLCLLAEGKTIINEQTKTSTFLLDSTAIKEFVDSFSEHVLTQWIVQRLVHVRRHCVHRNHLWWWWCSVQITKEKGKSKTNHGRLSGNCEDEGSTAEW